MVPPCSRPNCASMARAWGRALADASILLDLVLDRPLDPSHEVIRILLCRGEILFIFPKIVPFSEAVLEVERM